MTKEEFEKLLRSSEKKRVEFKGKVDFKVFQEHFAVTLISMANINGEGLDLPEVSLIGILDADKKDFCVLKLLSFKLLAELRETWMGE